MDRVNDLLPLPVVLAVTMVPFLFGMALYLYPVFRDYMRLRRRKAAARRESRRLRA